MKKVCIYITTYNRLKYFKIALNSVLAQTYQDFELIILDNCSSDGTEQYVRTLNDARIQYIRHSENIGGSGNISYAFSHCSSSDYFAVVHDDDILHRDFLEKELLYMERDKNCAAVSCLANNIDDNGNLIKVANSTAKGRAFSGRNFFLEYLDKQSNLIFPATLYRTNFIEDNNIRPSPKAGPCADVVLYMDIERNGGMFAEIPEVLIDYRVYKNQDSTSHLEEMLIELMQYLSEDPYYGKLLREDIGGRRKYLNWYFKKLMIREASGCVNCQNALGYLKKMNNALEIPYQNIKKYEFELRLLNRCQPLAQFTYKVIKKVRT